MASLFSVGSVHLDRLELSRSMPIEIMNGPAMLDAVAKKSRRICSKANSMKGRKDAVYGCVPESQPGRRRAHGVVYTKNIAAIHDNHRNNTLLKALGGE